MTLATSKVLKVAHYLDGKWSAPERGETLDVINPATGEVLAQVPMGGNAEVGAAVDAAARAFPAWRRTPPEDRIQPLFKLKVLLEESIDEFARIITQENGKTL